MKAEYYATLMDHDLDGLDDYHRLMRNHLEHAAEIDVEYLDTLLAEVERISYNHRNRLSMYHQELAYDQVERETIPLPPGQGVPLPPDDAS